LNLYILYITKIYINNLLIYLVYIYYNNHKLNNIDSLKYIIQGIIIIIPIIKGNNFVQQNDIN